MATKRMTGKDYRKLQEEIRQNEKSLDSHVRQRILELVKIYPDATITQALSGKHINEKFIKHLPASTIITLIERIEKWSEDQQNVIQKKIEI
jgi:hypothetical protein